MTDEEMEELDNGIECEICTRNMATTVDHCHTTGIRRGYLCGLCNSGLGMFKDNVISLESAIEYLERTSYATWAGQKAS